MKFTSRVFATWQAFYQLMAAQPWPLHPTTQGKFGVFFGSTDKQEIEGCIVLGNPPPSSLQTATNLSKSNEFVLTLSIGTEVQGQSREETLARLEVLCDVAQDALRDPTSGRMTNAFNGASPQFPVDGMISWELTGFRPRFYPIIEGFGSAADLDVLFKTRI